MILAYKLSYFIGLVGSIVLYAIYAVLAWLLNVFLYVFTGMFGWLPISDVKWAYFEYLAVLISIATVIWAGSYVWRYTHTRVISPWLFWAAFVLAIPSIFLKFEM
jgi:hypothetical protein